MPNNKISDLTIFELGYMAKRIVLRLIDSLDYASDQLKNGVFNDSEPGPYRIIAVNAVRWADVG